MPRLVRVYALLLWLYPAGFRREYGEEMLRVLRERLRDTQDADERVWLWGWALGDLVVSALAERMKGELQMEAKTWERIAAVAAVAGGGALVLGLVLVPHVLSPYIWSLLGGVNGSPLGTAETAAMAFYYSQICLAFVLPPVLFLVVLAVLATRLWRQQTRVVAVGFAFSLIGLLAQLFIAYANYFNGKAFFPSMFSVNDLIKWPPWKQALYHILFSGAMQSPFVQLPFILGLVLLGIALLRARLLSRGNSVLLVVTVCALLWDMVPLSYVLSAALGLPDLLSSLADPPQSSVVGAVIAALYGLAWTVFGVTLWCGAASRTVPVPATNTR